MREDFDPYYLWLGIPPADQPPDHYRLLGITQFESDADVIRNAAEQRMRYLRTVTGPRAKRAQQLVNEIVAAQRILAEDASREKYNALITESPLAKRRGVSPPAVSTPGFEPPAIDTLDAGSHRRRGGRGGGDRKKDKATEGAKTSNALWWSIITMCIVVLILTVTMVLSKNAKREASRKAEIAMRDADRRAEIAQEAKAANADRKVEAALRRLEENAKQKAALRRLEENAKQKAAEEAKKKAEAEQKRKEAKKKAKEEAKRREEERKAQKLRDNPDKLLKSKGFEQKGGKWVFAREETLKKYSNELTGEWRAWKKLPQGNEAGIRAKLQKYNELLLATLQVDAMRLAVSEDFTQALYDNAVASAMRKLNVKTAELNSTAKALKRPDAKLKKAVPRKPPVIGDDGNWYAALIINEKVGVVVHIDEKLLGQKDGPSLFFLPRPVQSKANLHITGNGQKWMTNNYLATMLDSQVPKLRFGLQSAQNFPINFHPTRAEGGVSNGEATWGGKVGEQAWKKFTSQLQPAKINHSPAVIAEARKKLGLLFESYKNETAKTPHPPTHTNESFGESVESMLRPFNPAQQKLLLAAMTEYRRITRREFEDLLVLGSQLGKTRGASFGLGNDGNAGRGGKDWNRFKFLAWHHPDCKATQLAGPKKSPEPFMQEALKASLKRLQNTPAWRKASKKSKKQSNAKRESQRPVVNYEELKEQLTAVEKEIKLALGKFNKEAKAYMKTKKELIKRIKSGESLIEQRVKQIDRIVGDAQQIKFAQETESKIIEPIKDLKDKLVDLRKPSTSAVDTKLQQADRLLKQIKMSSEYQKNPNAIDAIKSTFSKYRRGLKFQNSKIRKPIGIELTSQRTGIVAVFMHKGGPQEPARMTLYANGHINSLDSPATWSRFGNRLTLRWPTPGAPGGVWIDSCKLSPDGKKFDGVNQSGYAIHGWHVSGDIFSHKSF